MVAPSAGRRVHHRPSCRMAEPIARRARDRPLAAATLAQRASEGDHTSPTRKRGSSHEPDAQAREITLARRASEGVRVAHRNDPTPSLALRASDLSPADNWDGPFKSPGNCRLGPSLRIPKPNCDKALASRLRGKFSICGAEAPIIATAWRSLRRRPGRIRAGCRSLRNRGAGRPARAERRDAAKRRPR